MPTIWQTSQLLWHTLVPHSLRESPPARKLKTAFLRLLPYNVVYNSDYFKREVEGESGWVARSAEQIGSSILSDLKPSSVIDVGCGTGSLLRALKAGGCRVFGLEYADAALEYCRQRDLDVRKFDITNESLADQPSFDVAISMEVAEHLPESSADRFVELLSRLSNRIVFTAAQPNQGGTDHVNEQMPSYWIAKFENRHFELDSALTDRWKQEWERSGTVAGFYQRNLMIFRRRGVS